MKELYETARKIAAGQKPRDFARGKSVESIQLSMGLVEFDIATRLMTATHDRGSEWRLIRSCLRKRDMQDRLSELFAMLVAKGLD